MVHSKIRHISYPCFDQELITIIFQIFFFSRKHLSFHNLMIFPSLDSQKFQDNGRNFYSILIMSF
jgi:hypothetical protein